MISSKTETTHYLQKANAVQAKTHRDCYHDADILCIFPECITRCNVRKMDESSKEDKKT